jgi:hypothetical protein
VPIRVITPFTSVQRSAVFESLYARYWPSEAGRYTTAVGVARRTRSRSYRARNSGPIGRLGSSRGSV